jgi:hypothetical protein
MKKIGKCVRALGLEATVEIINQQYALQVSKSPTRAAELKAQLTNPKAGPMAHLGSCAACAEKVKIAADGFLGNSGPLHIPASTPAISAIA